MEHAYDLSLICMPLPTSLIGNHVYPHLLNDSLVPSQLPWIQTMLRRTDIAESLSSFSVVSLTLHVHSACHQLTLANLYEGGKTLIPGTNQRHMIFLLTRMGHFSYIIIDEAGQATESEAFVSIKTLADPKTDIVLSGDPKQLDPIICSGICHPSWVGIKLHWIYDGLFSIQSVDRIW